MTRLFLPLGNGKIGQSLREKDQVALLAWSSVVQTIRCILSMRPASGGEPVPIVIDLTTTSNRLTSTAVVIIQQDGEIDGGAIFSVGASGLTQRGMCYAQVAQVGGRANLFMAGYVYSGHAPRYGEIEEPGPAQGHGNITKLALGTPGAGADPGNSVVPTGALWKHRGFAAQLVTAVAAGNREFSIAYSDGTNKVAGTMAAEIQTASLTEDYLGANQAIASGISAGLGTGAIALGISDILLIAGWTIIHKTYNIQGADQWSASFEVVEEWVIPN